MEYSIKELSELAGVSSRTLRYYDEIGLLKPMLKKENGYRFYGEKQVEILQQILFYRERGFKLEKIAEILCHDDFDIVQALNEHLKYLEDQNRKILNLIQTVKNTISAMKGEINMSDKEKFEVFKQNLVNQQEKLYGKEAREKYGAENVDFANSRIMGMSEVDYERFKNLGNEILKSLNEAVNSRDLPESEKGKRIVLLHKEWLGFTWKEYTTQAHKGLAEMYVEDKRFTEYYDKETKGCAEFLKKAVEYWIEIL